MSEINWSRRIKVSISVGGGTELLEGHGDTPVALPDGFRVDDNGLERRISWRWFSWYAMRGILFAVIFSVPIAGVLYAYVNSSDKSWPTPALVTTALFALPPLAILYGWLAYLVNRTTICIDAAHISVRHGPLPWWGAKDVAKIDIDAVISEKIINDASDSSDGTMFRPREIYQVKLQLKSGKTVRLITGLRAAEQALFIDQQIRKR